MLEIHTMGHQMRLGQSLLACYASLFSALWPIQMPWNFCNGFSMHNRKVNMQCSSYFLHVLASERIFVGSPQCIIRVLQADVGARASDMALQC